MHCKIFYSWQSDLPNPTNRSFIESALEKAVKAIRKDDSIEIEPVIDRDTRGIPGAPPIADTIFSKIDHADVFLCDVSIINHDSSSRLTPNPNVLIELGYAIKKLGEERVILVMNSTWGGPEQLPFDLRARRVIVYNVEQATEDKSISRRMLEKAIAANLEPMLRELESLRKQELSASLSHTIEVLNAVNGNQPNQTTVCREFMRWLIDELNKLNPNFVDSHEQPHDELLLEALGKTSSLVIEYIRVVRAVASMNAIDAAREIYKGFGKVIDKYERSPTFSGSYKTTDYDFYKFIGHELFVIFFSYMILEERWEMVTHLFTEALYVENSVRGPDIFSYTEVSQEISLLRIRKDRLKLNRSSVHADILSNRYTEGEIGSYITHQQFMDADYFLFVHSIAHHESDVWRNLWYPWSILYLKIPPKYLVEAQYHTHAEKILKPLGARDIEALRDKFERSRVLRAKLFPGLRPYGPLDQFDLQQIGSKTL